MNDLSNERFMTVKEVAEVLGVGVRTIHDSIDRLNLAGTFKVEKVNGKTTYLNEKQVTAIKQEIQKHHNLASQKIQSVKTQLEENEIVYNAIQILIKQRDGYKDRVREQEKELTEIRPQAEIARRIAHAKNSLSMDEVAKELGWGRNRLFKFLRDKKVLMSGNDKNLPFQKYIDAGYFEVVAKNIELAEYRNKVISVTRVTPKGLAWLAERLPNQANLA